MNIIEENVAKCRLRCPTTGENLTNCSSRCLFYWKKHDKMTSRVPFEWRKQDTVSFRLPYMPEGGLELVFHIKYVTVSVRQTETTAGLTLNLAKINFKCPLRARTKIINEDGPSALYHHWTSESFLRFPTASTEWDVFLPFSLIHIISIIQAWVNSF